MSPYSHSGDEVRLWKLAQTEQSAQSFCGDPGDESLNEKNQRNDP